MAKKLKKMKQQLRTQISNDKQPPLKGTHTPLQFLGTLRNEDEDNQAYDTYKSPDAKAQLAFAQSQQAAKIVQKPVVPP